MQQTANAVRELTKARKEADDAYLKELQAPRQGTQKMDAILTKTVESIAVRGSRSLVRHRLLAGGGHAVALQDMGNDPREIEVTGLLVADASRTGKGPTVEKQVAALQEALRAGTPMVFATDTPGLEGFGPTVVLSDFKVLASEDLVGGVRFRYRLVEVPPAPPKRRGRSRPKGPSEDWARLQAMRRTTGYATKFVNPATGMIHGRLDEVVRDRMLKLGTITGLL
jgi:hypothetical protein